MSTNETMKELAQYLRMQEEITETVEGLNISPKQPRQPVSPLIDRMEVK